VPAGFAFGAAVFWLARPTTASLAAGSAIAAVGVGLRVWASGHLNKAREVTTSGPYRWFAHPLYMGSSIIGVGLAIASHDVVAAVLIGVYLLTTLTAAMRSEERYLQRTFGDRYDRYRSGRDVNAEAERRRFSFAKAIANREHRALVGVVVAVLLLALKATYNGSFWRMDSGG
jgi:hypothetical protein